MKQQVNLFKVLPRRTNVPFSFLEMILWGVGGLLMLFIFSAALSYQARLVSNNFRKISDQQISYQKKISGYRTEFPEQYKAQQELKHRIDSLEQEIEIRKKMLASFGGEKGMGNSKGFSNYFMAFSNSIVPHVWLTSFDINDGGSTINIKGNAIKMSDVLLFLSRLKKQEPFVSQKLELTELTHSPDETAESSKVSFLLEVRPG